MTDTTETVDLPSESATNPDGRWGVNLHMRFDAPDQEVAVQKFLANTLRVGLGNYAFSVKDRTTGELFYVEDGRIFTEDEFEAYVEGVEAEADKEAGGDNPDD